ALRLPRSPNIEPVEQVVQALSEQASLLILDNFEHLIAEGAPIVHTLLSRAPALTCMVTSRQALNLSGEWELPVLPLPVPNTTTRIWECGSVPEEDSIPLLPYTHTPEQLLTFPSVQLFVDRARAIRPDFQVTDGNAKAIAGLCERLEGIPL